jgi:hypothetical protein
MENMLVIINYSNVKIQKQEEEYRDFDFMNDGGLLEMKAFIGLLLHCTMFWLNHEHLRLFATDGLGRDIFYYVIQRRGVQLYSHVCNFIIHM